MTTYFKQGDKVPGWLITRTPMFWRALKKLQFPRWGTFQFGCDVWVAVEPGTGIVCVGPQYPKPDVLLIHTGNRWMDFKPAKPMDYASIHTTPEAFFKHRREKRQYFHELQQAVKDKFDS